MEEFILSFMENYGYLAVFILVCVENLFPPIPSEVILTFGGFSTNYTELNIIWLIIISTLGTLLGAYILYFIGKFFNKERLKKIISGKIGKLLRLKEKDIEKADEWFDKKGQKTVFFCRFIPIVRSLISIPAGMSEMPILKFSLYTLLGTIIWNTVLIILGSVLGESWKYVVEFMDKYSYLTLIILIILFILAAIWFFLFRNKKKGDNSGNTR